jgi:hypothetical protein
MSTDAPLPPLSSIEKTSQEFQRLASSVNGHLDAFHQWLNALPGKMEVSIQIPDEGFQAIRVSLGRVKDKWRLLFGRGNSLSPEDVVAVDDIANASLIDKCTAISLLPELLMKFHKEQRSAVTQLQRANQIFAQLPANKGGQ